MNSKIDIKDIKFGSIDARKEFLSRDPSIRKLFLESYYIPPSVDIERLKMGEDFIVVGPKGSGKTALLRYLSSLLDEDSSSVSRFIIFRDDVNEQNREKLAKLAEVRVYEEGDEDTSSTVDSADCTAAWQIFIHREIAEVLQKHPDMYASTPEILNYIDAVQKFFSNFTTSGFKKLLQKIGKGRVKMGAYAAGFIEAEATFLDQHGNIDVSEFARFCNQALSRIFFNEELDQPRINIFFDEVNLTFVSGQNFKRNSILVRDLVAACGMLNTQFSENQIPIYLYTALRSEVISSVEGSVRELAKWVEDSGANIDWLDKSDKPSFNQPLMQLLQQRIVANEKRLQGSDFDQKKFNFLNYFDEKSLGIPLSSYLIFETWGRPRDLVRLLTLAQSKVAKGGKFEKPSFLKVAEEYSKSCWEEKSDELNTKYAQAEIEAIKRVLVGLPTRFSRNELDARISYQCNNDPRAKQFFSGRNQEILLEDLHRVGIMGNIVKTVNNNSRPIYEYSDHRAFDSSEILCIHRSLWRALNLNNDYSDNGNQRRNRRR